MIQQYEFNIVKINNSDLVNIPGNFAWQPY